MRTLPGACRNCNSVSCDGTCDRPGADADRIAQLTAELAEARSLNRIAFGVVAEVGPQLRTAHDVLIPAWQGTAATLRMWMLGWNLAAAGLCASRDAAQAEAAAMHLTIARFSRTIDAMEPMAPNFIRALRDMKNDTAGRALAARVTLLEAVARGLKAWRDQLASDGPPSGTGPWIAREIDSRFPELAALATKEPGE